MYNCITNVQYHDTNIMMIKLTCEKQYTIRKLVYVIARDCKTTFFRNPFIFSLISKLGQRLLFLDYY